MTAADPHAQAQLAVRLAVEYGFHVFPVDHPTASKRCAGIKTREHNPDTCNERGKHPTCKWSEWATNDAGLLAKPHYFGGVARNIGIDCGKSALLVLDEDALEEVARFCADHHLTLPATLTVRTAAGHHYYFRQPDGEQLGNREGALRGYTVNVRGAGGYVVGPGSVHASGVTYTAVGAVRELAPVPPALVAALKGREVTGINPNGDDGASWRNGPVPIKKRHGAMVAAAGWCRRMGLKRDEALPFMRDVFARLDLSDGKYTWDQCLGRLDDIYARYPAGYRIDVGDLPDQLPSANRQPGPRLDVRRLDTVDPEPAAGAGPAGQHLTDLGNARRLIARHGADLRYCTPRRCWLVWDGTRWRADATDEVVRFAKDTVGAIYAEAADEQDPSRRKAIARWATSSEARVRIDAMIALAASEPGVPVLPEQLDADPWSLNCLNGMIDLRTGELRAHHRDDLITRTVPVHYDPEARLPLWDDFLRQATGGDDGLAAFLGRLSGYTATGLTHEEVLAFLYGGTASGKSTFLEALNAALGDYAATADFETFLARREAGGPRQDIARLAGKRFVKSIEVDDGKKLAAGLVKNITGGENITARFLYGCEFEFLPTFKLWLAANDRPQSPRR